MKEKEIYQAPHAETFFIHSNLSLLLDNFSVQGNFEDIVDDGDSWDD